MFATQHKPPILGEYLTHGVHATLDDAVRAVDRKVVDRSTRTDGHRCTEDCHRIEKRGKTGKVTLTMTIPEAREALKASLA